MKYLIFKLILLVSLFGATYSQAGYRETFEKAFMTNPWGGVRSAISACVECHSDTDDCGDSGIVEDWQQSWHAQNEVSCHDCHGGGPDDASMAMSHQRGFLGAPKHKEVPQFCGKCHVGILKNYLESGHGKSLASTDTGPNCVNCHGSHNIKQANINIINEKLCTQCHSYDRAKLMREALLNIENKLAKIQIDLDTLKSKGMNMQDQKRAYFRAHSEFRILFHTIDVELVKERSADFMARLDVIEAKTDEAFEKLSDRRKFSGFLLLLFSCLSIAAFFLITSYE